MLSPGKYNQNVPRDLIGNVAFRLSIIQQCKTEEKARAAVMKMCREDVLFFFAVFVWQYNPDEFENEVGPFIPYEFQEKAIVRTVKRRFFDRKDMLWEKSRKIGATWMAMGIDAWLCLFHERKKILHISHSQEAVDRPEDTDSLYWKVRFIHEHMPDWLSRKPKKRKMRFMYPATRSVMTGVATSKRSGVGGRATGVTLDEFSKQQDDFKILGQTRDTGPRLFIGTHYELDSAFYQLTQRKDMAKCVMHWSDHPVFRRGLYRVDTETNQVEVLDPGFVYPNQCSQCGVTTKVKLGEKTECCEAPAREWRFVMTGKPSGGPHPGIRSPWYDDECIERDNDRDVAMHLDIDPKGAVAQFFDGVVIQSLVSEFACDPYWEGDIEYDSETGKSGSLVKTAGGLLKLWCPVNDGMPERGKYGIAGDIAQGSGATPSCLSIMNLATGDKAGEYANARIGPEDLAVLAVALGWVFLDENDEPAQLIWELPGPGATFGKKVMELGYGNLYYREENMEILGPRISDKPGWSNTPKACLLLLQDYKTALRTRHCVNRSERALRECLDFKYDSSGNVVHAEIASVDDPSGARINHGDRVMADALGWKLVKLRGIVVNHVTPGKAREKEIQPGSFAWRRQRREQERHQEEQWI